MIFCNGCSKTGTHLITNLVKLANIRQIGGTIVKRHDKFPLTMKGSTSIAEIMSKDNTYFVHAHLAYKEHLNKRLVLGKHKMIHIIRNPRNVAVSWLRHKNKLNPKLKLTKENFKLILQDGMFQMAVAKHYSGYTPWTEQDNVLTVRFEDLVSRDKVVHTKKVFDYIGTDLPDIDKIDTSQNSPTYTGRFSEWIEWWGSEVDIIWKKTEGFKLERKLGYENVW